MGFSAPDAQIPALMTASTLYGVNLVMFFFSLQRLFREQHEWKRGRNINFLMATIVIILFMASTTSLALQLTLVVRGHMYLEQSRPDEFLAERGRIGVPKASMMVFETVIADSILLFRCWMVWNKMLIAIILPMLLWVGCMGSSVYAIYCLYHRTWSEPTPVAATERTYPALAAFWTCTIMVNIYCTGMIIGRICSVQQGWNPPTICSLRDVPQRGRMQLAKRIIIESAMLYTLTSVAAFINHLCQSPGLEIACQAVRSPRISDRSFSHYDRRHK